MTPGIVFAHGIDPSILIAFSMLSGVPFILSGAILLGLMREVCRKVAVEVIAFRLLLASPVLLLAVALFIWALNDGGWEAVAITLFFCLPSAPVGIGIVLLFQISVQWWKGERVLGTRLLWLVVCIGVAISELGFFRSLPR